MLDHKGPKRQRIRSPNNDNHEPQNNARKYLGYIDLIDERGVRGWALSSNALENPVRVGLLLDGKIIGSVRANLPRNDLHSSISENGRAGFCFDQPPVAPGDESKLGVAVLDSDDVPVHQIARYPFPEKVGVFPKPLSHYPSDAQSGLEQAPLFILGAARSGTSALQAVATRTLGYVGFNEGHIVPLINTLQSAISKFYAENEERRREHSMLAAVDKGYWDGALAELTRRMFQQMFGSRPWLDKTPSATMLNHVPFVSVCWPKAKFVFAKRRAIENIQSRRRKFAKFPFQDHCWDWRACMQTWLALRQNLHGRFIEIDQMEMMRNPTRVATELRDFLNLSAEQEKAFESGLRELRPETTLTSDAPLSLAEVGWTPAEKEFFLKECGPTLQAYGYSLDKSYYL
jgi:hypothetical protein